MEPEASSEEKLLKLIRKKPTAGVRKNPARGPEKKVIRPTAGRTDFDAAGLINKLFLLIVIGTGVYIVWHIAQTSFLNKSNLILEESAVMPDVEPVPVPSAAKPLNYYEEIVAQRDIFNTSFQKTVPAAGSQTASQVQQVNPLQHLTLVGVVLDEAPQAIIHNQTTQETLFLKTGDSVDGVVVEDVREEKVTIRFQGQSIDLTL